MDNDNEIGKEIRGFLQDELNKYTLEEEQTTYDFEKKYAESKKASARIMWRNMWSRFLICFAVVGVMVAVTLFFTNRYNRSIAVQVREFDDINLRDILRSYSILEDSLRDARNEKLRLEQERDFRRIQAESQRRAERDILDNMNIKDAEARRKKLREIESDYNLAIQDSMVNDGRIQELDELIAGFTRQLEQYEPESFERAERQKSVIDSEGQLNEMQRASMQDSYEKKLADLRQELTDTKEADRRHLQEMVGYVMRQYDPAMSDASEAARRAVSESRSLPSSESFSAEANSNAADDFNLSVSRVEDYYRLMRTIEGDMAGYPQKDENAIKSFTRALVRLSHAAGNDLLSASEKEINSKALRISELQGDLSQAERSISVMSGYFDSQLAAMPARANCPVDGIIISAPESGSVKVYVSRSANDYFMSQAEGNELLCVAMRGSSAVRTAGRIYLERETDAARIFTLRFENDDDISLVTKDCVITLRPTEKILDGSRANNSGAGR